MFESNVAVERTNGDQCGTIAAKFEVLPTPLASTTTRRAAGKCHCGAQMGVGIRD